MTSIKTGLIGALPVAVLILLWYFLYRDTYLWYDELQSVTVSGRDLPEFLFSNLVYEPHISLYYVLLHFWQLIFRSDLSILSLSLLLAIIADVILFNFLRPRLGTGAALAGALAFAVQPLTLYWSGQTRMYTFVMLASLLLFIANARYFERRSEGADKRGFAEIIAAAFLLGYSHALGIIFTALIQACFFLTYLRHEKMRGWFITSIAAGIIILPAALFSVLHKLGHALKPSLADLLHGFSIFTLGPGELSPVYGAIGFVLFLVLLSASFLSRPSNSIPPYLGAPFLAGLLLGTILFAFVASRLFLAIWIDLRTFAFLAPVWSMTVALIASLWLRNGQRAAVAALVILGLGTASGIAAMVDDRKDDDWPATVAAFRNGRQDGDLVVVGNDRERWSFNHYYFGIGWQDGYSLDWPKLFSDIRARKTGPKQIVADMAEIDRSLSARDGVAVLTLKEMASMPPAGGRIWYATESWNCKDAVADTMGQIIETLDVHGMCVQLRQP